MSVAAYRGMLCFSQVTKTRQDACKDARMKYLRTAFIAYEGVKIPTCFSLRHTHKWPHYVSTAVALLYVG